MTQPHANRMYFRIPRWLGLLLSTSIALFFLWEEHEALLLGALPWLSFLACPLIHLFMHRGHDDGHATGGPPDGSSKATSSLPQHRGGRT